ncbi:hypothetical protein LEN26_012404 [Aphanomyces euteiches]|nr:hypothetical protein LEN26_012404 [Aphanomyces euteiches]
MEVEYPGLGWFDHVAFHVSSHSIDGIVTQGHAKSAVYTISIRSKRSHAKLYVAKSDFSLETLRDELCAALDHGHVCQAACPWYFVDMDTHIPKRRVFTSSTSNGAISSHIQMFQSVLDHTLAYILCPESRSCKKPVEVLPPIFFRFLFGGVRKDAVPAGLFDHAAEGTKLSPKPNYHAQTKALALDVCMVCKITLHGSAKELSVSGISTLPCKHSFHDECIVEALNDSLECPSCVAQVAA